MKDSETRLLTDRANRAAARELVDGGIAQVKSDLAARGVGGRIKDKLTGEVEDAVATGIDVARQNKPVIAGTIGLLLVWFLRGPLGRMARRAFASESDEIQDLGDSGNHNEDPD
ncbi:MAG: hypothetical protein ACKOQM_01970 [Novosphingobium sp.]